MAASRGINVGTVHQARQTYSAPKPKPKPKPAPPPPPPKPAPKPAAKVTLKPLVNKKGKVVGMGHFKGNETQNTAAIPKKAPSTPAAKAQLKAAVAKAPAPIAKSAQKKQAEVLAPKPKPKPKAKAPAPKAPAPKAPAKAPVTLKPLVNNKGKVVGMGHFKGNETQNKAAIPKKAPSTPVAKAKLKEAVAKAPAPIAKSAQKAQAKALAPKPKPKPKAPAPAPKPAPADAKVTLKPLVNKKGKVVGMGQFKGNETQDRSAIPKKAPSTPAAKAQLKAAVAKAPAPIAKSAQKAQAKVLAPKAKPKAPAPKAPADAPVTLKPLVNKKGKTIGLGHFKGNETQDRSAIPKKAPSTPAGKQALLQAIAKTPTPIAKSATVKQKEVLPKKPLKDIKRKSIIEGAVASGVSREAALGVGLMKSTKNAQKKVNAAVPYANTELGKGDVGGQINIMKQPVNAKTGGSQRNKLKTVATRSVNKDAAIRGAIAGGVDPKVAGSLGLVKKTPNIQKKSKGAQIVAQAGGDAQAQMDVMNAQRPVNRAVQSVPGVKVAKQYGDQVKAINAYNDSLTAGSGSRFRFGQGGAFDDDAGLKRKKKKRGDRYSNSKGTSSLRIPLNIGSPAGLAGGGGGINP